MAGVACHDVQPPPVTIGVQPVDARERQRSAQLYLAASRVRQTLTFPYLAGVVALGVLVLVWNYRRLRDVGSRRRIRWFVAGTVVALVPWVAFVVAYNILGLITPSR
jgi:hypothetical protein